MSVRQIQARRAITESNDMTYFTVDCALDYKSIKNYHEIPKAEGVPSLICTSLSLYIYIYIYARKCDFLQRFRPFARDSGPEVLVQRSKVDLFGQVKRITRFLCTHWIIPKCLINIVCRGWFHTVFRKCTSVGHWKRAGVSGNPFVAKRGSVKSRSPAQGTMTVDDQSVVSVQSSPQRPLV